jgi:uncharacterized protein YxeA
LGTIEKQYIKNCTGKIIFMKKVCLLVFMLQAMVVSAFAQDEQPYTNKSFVIIQSTKDYKKAKGEAIKASQQLKQQLDLRALTPNGKAGLTYSEKECENEGGYPCYIARGRYDDGDYVSIEWSNAFTGFAKGYYIVVVYSGNTAAASIVLSKAKKIFKDAYTKQARVYIGCMH